jgi:hypothetical protein
MVLKAGTRSKSWPTAAVVLREGESIIRGDLAAVTRIRSRATVSLRKDNIRLKAIPATHSFTAFEDYSGGLMLLITS